MLPQPDADAEAAFHQRFADLVEASGLSIRDLARRTNVGRSTIDGWKRGKALPQNHNDLIQVVQTLQTAVTAVGANGDTRGNTQRWALLLRHAKEARDARSYPARRQPGSRGRDALLDSERRARTIAATGKAMEALSALLDLDVKPDWQRDRKIWAGEDTQELSTNDQAAVDTWERHWREHLRIFRLAILDIGDADLKARLEESLQIMQLWEGPMKYARQGEGRTRYLAANDGLEAVGAFRRGDPPPDPSADYQSTSSLVSTYLDELESNSRY